MDSRQWKHKCVMGRMVRALCVSGALAVLIGLATPALGQLRASWCAPDSPFGNASTGETLEIPSAQHPSPYLMAGNEDWHDVYVHAGATLDTRGYRLRVCGTLTNEGTITDSRTGGAGGLGGAFGKGQDPYQHYDCDHRPLCTNGIDGEDGHAPSVSQGGQRGRGGRGGGGGGGGGGAWWSLVPWDSDGGNGGIGGTGGKGGGYVKIYAYRFSNPGVIKANGLDGSAGYGVPGDACACSYLNVEVCGPEHCDNDDGAIQTDASGGGGGGGGGGAGGNGGTITVYYCQPHPVVQGDCQVGGGAGGSGGQPGGGCYNHYGITFGGFADGCQGGAPNGGDGGRGTYADNTWSGTGTSGTTGAGGANGFVGFTRINGWPPEPEPWPGPWYINRPQLPGDDSNGAHPIYEPPPPVSPVERS